MPKSKSYDIAMSSGSILKKCCFWPCLYIRAKRRTDLQFTILKTQRKTEQIFMSTK